MTIDHNVTETERHMRQEEDAAEELHSGLFYPYCQKCGWRKGGIDSWDGTRCKCGHMASGCYVAYFEAHINEVKA